MRKTRIPTCEQCLLQHPASQGCRDAKIAAAPRIADEGRNLVGRKPEYRLKAMNKATGEKSRNTGAAWVNADGSISIDIEPFVVLQGGKDLVLTLFPEGKKE